MAPVVLFSSDLSGNGVSRNTVRLANALAQRQVDTHVICLADGALADELRGPRLTLLGRRSANRVLALTGALTALRRELTALSPSVLVSMGNHAHLAVWAATRGLAFPRLYRISNDPVHPFDGWLRNGMRSLGLRLIATDAEQLICVSYRLAERSVFRRAAEEGRIVVAPNGVDVARIMGRAAEPFEHPWLTDGEPFVVALGRLHPQKNYGVLLKAFAAARTRSGDRLRLAILGRGSPSQIETLSALAASLGVGGAVRFEGEVANPFPLLSRASAFVLPSLWEGASNSLLEALACRVPVVASTTAGNAAEVLDGGRYGRLFEPSDLEAMAQAIVDQALPGPNRVMPGDRAEDYDLDEALRRMTGLVLAARRHARPTFAGRPGASGDAVRT